MPKTHKPKLSELQRNWLDTRYEEGRNVLVLVGSPEGIAIFEDKAWNDKQTIGQLYSRDEIATWMTNKLCVVKPSINKETLMTLELYNAGTEQGEILALLIKAKGQELVSHPEQSPLADSKFMDEPTLIDQGHVMHGTMVIALYLEQRYPSPCLLPQDPCKSSIVMMLFRNILKTGREGLDLQGALGSATPGTYAGDLAVRDLHQRVLEHFTGGGVDAFGVHRPAVADGPLLIGATEGADRGYCREGCDHRGSQDE